MRFLIRTYLAIAAVVVLSACSAAMPASSEVPHQASAEPKTPQPAASPTNRCNENPSGIPSIACRLEGQAPLQGPVVIGELEFSLMEVREGAASGPTKSVSVVLRIANLTEEQGSSGSPPLIVFKVLLPDGRWDVRRFRGATYSEVSRGLIAIGPVSAQWQTPLGPDHTLKAARETGGYTVMPTSVLFERAVLFYDFDEYLLLGKGSRGFLQLVFDVDSNLNPRDLTLCFGQSLNCLSNPNLKLFRL